MQEVPYLWIVKKNDNIIFNSITCEKFPDINSNTADEFYFMSLNDSIIINLQDKTIHINGKKQEFDTNKSDGIFDVRFIKRNQGIKSLNTYSSAFEAVVSYRLVITYKRMSSSVGRIYEVLPVQCTGDRVLQLCNESENTWFLELDDHKKLYIKLPSIKELKYVR